MFDTIALDERITKCELILEQHPDSQIFAALADAQRKRGELDKAFRICRQGLRLHPDYGAGHLVMAKINFDRKMYDWAETELSEAIRLDGRTRSTDILQAEIYTMQAKYVQAKQLVDELIRSDPNNENFRTLINKIEAGQAELRRRQLEANKLYRAQGSTTTEVFLPKEGGQEQKPLSPQEALLELSKYPGVNAVFFTDLNGMILEAQLPERFDQDSYAALSAEIYRFTTENVGKISFGKVSQILIEMLGERIWMAQMDGRILVAVISASVNLGSLKLRLSSILKRMAVVN